MRFDAIAFAWNMPFKRSDKIDSTKQQVTIKPELSPGTCLEKSGCEVAKRSEVVAVKMRLASPLSVYIQVYKGETTYQKPIATRF